jgi:hypothetical protein
MKMLKETLRKTAVVGIPLLVTTLIFTLVDGGQNCFGGVRLSQSLSILALLPVLRYYVFTAAIFAFYGFSFVFTRKASDVYHSLPVKRSDLYLSVTLATVLWMGGTIVLNALELLAIYLISGCPFVPAYFPLSVLYYFVASMIVFAASAIGCALSGTVVTALASAGIVLLLPRFVQFLFARGIVERVSIVGWLDLGKLLDPTTNVATGIAAEYLRPVYASRLITMPHILYSLLPMLVMLAIGYWLFNRRPSEIAQKNGGYPLWTVITATLLAFAVMMPISMNHRNVFSVYGAVLMLAALAVFFIYQLIVSSKIQQVLKTLPYFLIAVFAALGVSLLISSVAGSMADTTPSAAEIESVTFRGYDESTGDPVYSSLLVSGVEFTDDATKEYVAQALQDAVAEMKKQSEDANYYDYDYNAYQAIEPVTIKLTNGKTVKRTIEFANIDELNALRMKNADFAKAVRTYPPFDSVQYLQVDPTFTREENEAIYQTFVAEAEANAVTSGYYYRLRSEDILSDGNYLVQGDNQSVTGVVETGYIGSQLYYDYNTLRLETPETIGLVMRTYNGYVEENFMDQISEAIDRFNSGEAARNDSLNINVSVFNYADASGALVQEYANFYLSQYTLESEYQYDKQQHEYLIKYINALSGAVMTDDPTGTFIQLTWSYYDSTSTGGSSSGGYPEVFLRFENQADEQAFLNLVSQWDTTQRTITY